MKKKKKLLFVTLRYGVDIYSGIELHTRLLAEHLKDVYDITVLTTKAKTYVTWKNEYKDEKEVINDIEVIRCSVDHQRYDTTLDFSIYKKDYTEERGDEWIKAAGPYSTELFTYLKKHGNIYDYIIFAPYEYALTYYGLPLVQHKALIIPAAHDHSTLYVPINKRTFSSVRGLICSTPEELNLIHSVFHNIHIPSAIIGVGVEEKAEDIKELKDKSVLRQHDIQSPYILFLGRIDEGKGILQCIDYFTRYKQNYQNNLSLVLAGKPVIDLPDYEDIYSVGPVSVDQKQELLSHSLCLLNPSAYESLSMVVLEAWQEERPVLVNGKCDVLVGQCKRSNGGLWYDNYEEFEAMVNWLFDHPSEAGQMGTQGKKYYQENYSWDVIIHKFQKFIESLPF